MVTKVKKTECLKIQENFQQQKHNNVSYNKERAEFIKINHINYIKIDTPILNVSSIDDFAKELDKVGGIYKGIKEIKQGGFFSSGYVILEVLIPKNRLKEYSKITLKTEKCTNDSTSVMCVEGTKQVVIAVVIVLAILTILSILF
jgi:hypothetical protein